MKALLVRAAIVLVTLLVMRFFPSLWCGRDAKAWLDGDVETERALADELVRFEEEDDKQRAAETEDRFAGEWALVTHQMIALGLAQVCLAHPELKSAYVPVVTKAAIKSFGADMRGFGTRAWNEDALGALATDHGHAYLAYAALAIGMARVLDPSFPADVAAKHDALVAAYERRLLASPTGLIETYPGEAYPTDVAAVAATLAVHARIGSRTDNPHTAALAHWADRVYANQIDGKSGFVIQRMGARDGVAHDAPRGSGTALAAYFVGFADRGVHRALSEAALKQERVFFGFGGVREYPDGYSGRGDVDSGPVLFGVSVSATGFALAPARALKREEFVTLYRTADLFGMPARSGARSRFLTGGAIGNALLLAMLTSGPELAP